MNNDQVILKEPGILRRLLLVLLLGMVLAAPVLGQQNVADEKNGKDVDSLIKELKYGNDTTRSEAATALGNINDSRGFEQLMQALDDKNSSVRQNAVLAIDSLTGGSLIQSLKNKDIEVRECAIYKLGRLGVNGPLIQVLKDQNQNISVRESAAFALGSVGNKEAVEPLIQALNDSNPNLRAEAAVDLGDIGDKLAVEPLIRALKDENSTVRNYAAQGLRGINDSRAVEPLIQALTDNDSGVRGSAASALGILNDVRATGPLNKLLKEDNDYFVKEFAAYALEEIKNRRPNSIPAGEAHSREFSLAADYCNISFPQNLSLSIDISSITPGEAAAGNFQPVDVHFNVTRLGLPLFGLQLDNENLELDTLNAPPNGPEVVSSGIGVEISEGFPSNYEMSIEPATYQGKQYTWAAGTYKVKLHCINAGKELANRTFSFSIA